MITRQGLGQHTERLWLWASQVARSPGKVGGLPTGRGGAHSGICRHAHFGQRKGNRGGRVIQPGEAVAAELFSTEEDGPTQGSLAPLPATI